MDALQGLREEGGMSNVCERGAASSLAGVDWMPCKGFEKRAA